MRNNVQPNYNLLAKLLKPFKVNLEPEQPVVALDIEYGYKTYVWIPEMTCLELERWWLRQQHIGKFYELPCGGTFLQDVTKSIPYGSGDWDYLHYDTTVWTTYNYIKNAHLGYHAHIFCDEDSYLITPRKRHIHHAGYWPARKKTDKDVMHQLTLEDLEKVFGNATEVQILPTKI